MVAARVYFLVIIVEWSLFVIFFSAWNPLLFFRIVVCIVREAYEFKGCTSEGRMFLSRKTKTWPVPLSSQLGWFCPLYLWEGRQTAWSPVNAAATIGLAASRMKVPWVNYKGIISVPSSYWWFSRRGLIQTVLLEFHFNMLHDRTQEPMDMNLLNSNDQLGTISEISDPPILRLLLDSNFLRVGYSPKGQPGNMSGCQTPGRGSQASRPLVFIHSFLLEMGTK